MIYLKKLDTLLFDLDGTLVDSNECILETFRRTFLRYLPTRVFSKTELIAMMGPPLYETFQIVSTEEQTIQDMIQYYRKIYVEIEFDYIHIYPNVIDVLKYFKNNGFHIGIVTTKFQESAIPSIKAFGIDKYVDVLIGLDDVTHHKPHPEPVLKALSYFTHQEVLMIGDNSTDLLSGRNANTLTCGVEWSIKKMELRETNPDFWIKDFLDLIEIVQKYNKED